MKCVVHKLFFVSFIFLSANGLSQNLTGIWRGYFISESSEQYKFEIQIQQTPQNSVNGVSYSYLDTRFYGKATLKGNFNKATKGALVEEIKTVELKMSGSSTACIMKCIFTTTLLFLILTIHAQKGRNQLNIIGETSIPVFQNDHGWGISAKGMYGVGRSAQITLTAGFTVLKTKNTVEHSKTNTRMIPVLLGYKYNYRKFFIEPQAGYGELGGKIESGGDYARPSVGAFYWALGAGYDHKKIIAGSLAKRRRLCKVHVERCIQ